MSTEKKADFSNVTGGVQSTEQAVEKADFSNVQGGVTSTEEAITPEVQTYTIEKGDTLSKIAKEHYGAASAWKQIFEANRDVLDDPDRIFPGQIIKLPAAPSSES